MKTITILGKRWFEKTNGNTYHSVRIYVDGECVKTIGFSYGYGSMYKQNATTWLKQNNYIKLKEYESLWQYADRKKIKIIDEVIDVPRKKDLDKGEGDECLYTKLNKSVGVK